MSTPCHQEDLQHQSDQNGKVRARQVLCQQKVTSQEGTSTPHNIAKMNRFQVSRPLQTNLLRQKEL